MFLAFKKKWNQVDKKEKKRKENVIPFFFEGSDNFSNFLLVRGGSTFWIFYDVCMNTLYKGTCFCRCVWKNFLLSKMLVEGKKGLESTNIGIFETSDQIFVRPASTYYRHGHLCHRHFSDESSHLTVLTTAGHFLSSQQGHGMKRGTTLLVLTTDLNLFVNQPWSWFAFQTESFFL